MAGVWTTGLAGLLMALTGSGIVAVAETGARDTQAAICGVIDGAAAAYSPARAAYDSEQNPIMRERRATTLAAMRDSRDAAVLAILGSPSPTARNWRVRIREFRVSSRWMDGHTTKIAILNLDPSCQAPVTLTVEARLTAALADHLVEAKPGSVIDVSGEFLPHDMPPNPLARAINWDGFERPAMLSPSYRLRATRVGGVTVE